MQDTKIVGSFEPIDFPDFGLESVIAKIDTGAFSGTLHATNIQEIVGEDGQKILEFFPLGKKKFRATCKKYISKPVRSSNGHLETRFVITTKIILQGIEYPITISLADRSSMMKAVLIGRQFLRQQRFMVDVRKGTKYAYAVKESES